MRRATQTVLINFLPGQPDTWTLPLSGNFASMFLGEERTNTISPAALELLPSLILRSRVINTMREDCRARTSLRDCVGPDRRE